MTTETIKGAAEWASYLINGDESGLSAEEKALCDAWLERNEWPNIVDVSEPYFTWSYGLHTGDNVKGGEIADYTITIPANRVVNQD